MYEYVCIYFKNIRQKSFRMVSCRCFILHRSNYIAIVIHGNNDELFQKFVKGDRVRIDDDMPKATRLQKRHGGWNKKMKKVSVCLA